MQEGFPLAWAAAFLYVVYGVLILRSLRSSKALAGRGLLYGATLALVLHAVCLTKGIFGNGAVTFGFGLAASAALWAASFVIIVESAIRRVTVLMGFILLLSAPACLLPEVFPGFVISTDASFAFKTHLAFAFLAYGFTIDAAVQAVLITAMSRKIRHPVGDVDKGWLANMPDLMAMERIFFRIIVCAFLSVTGVLFFGAWVTSEYWHVIIGFDHKTILTWISWIVFAVLLIGRFRFGWRGKTALTWFWVAAAALVIAYLVYRLLIELSMG